jgi:hypothetical protein
MSTEEDLPMGDLTTISRERIPGGIAETFIATATEETWIVTTIKDKDGQASTVAKRAPPPSPVVVKRAPSPPPVVSAQFWRLTKLWRVEVRRDSVIFVRRRRMFTHTFTPREETAKIRFRQFAGVDQVLVTHVIVKTHHSIDVFHIGHKEIPYRVCSEVWTSSATRPDKVQTSDGIVYDLVLSQSRGNKK